MGSGPHLYFLHGFCEDSRIWNPIISELSLEYTCITIDLPGFGASSHLPFTSIPEVADAIYTVIGQESEGDELPVLFGHSLGGYVVAEYMSRYGATLSAAGLIHSSTAADTDIKRANRTKSIEFIEKHGTAEFFRIFVSGLVALEHRGRLRDSLTDMVLRTKVSSVVDGLKAIAVRGNRYSALASFDKPLLLLHGEQDTHYEKSELYHQSSLASITQLSVLQGVGHLSMLEDTEKCLAEMKHFLNLIDAL